MNGREPTASSHDHSPSSHEWLEWQKRAENMPQMRAGWDLLAAIPTAVFPRVAHYVSCPAGLVP